MTARRVISVAAATLLMSGSLAATAVADDPGGGTTVTTVASGLDSPRGLEFGPDGALYVLEWGRDFNYAGSGINPDSGLYRIEQRTGGLPALAEALRPFLAREDRPAPLGTRLETASLATAVRNLGTPVLVTEPALEEVQKRGAAA